MTEPTTAEKTLGVVSGWLRPLRPSDAAKTWTRTVRYHFAYEKSEKGQPPRYNLPRFLAAWALTLAALWYIILPHPVAASLLTMLAGMTALNVAYQCRTGKWPGKLTERAALANAGLVLTIAWTLHHLVAQPRLASLWAIACCEVLTRQPKIVPKKPPWWAYDNLLSVLVIAGVLTQGPDDDQRIGITTPIEDEWATWVTVKLPAGNTWEDASKKHLAIASALNLPEERLHIERDEDRNARSFNLAVLKPRRKLAKAAIPERFDFTQPVPLGPDRLGRPLNLRTRKTHTMFVAQTQNGKTWLARMFVCHAVADPRVPIFMANGKPDSKDWGALKPLCDMYETIDDLAGVERLFDHIQMISEYRGGIELDEDDPDDLPPPIVFMIEEWYRIRTALEIRDAARAKKLTKQLSALAAGCASRGIHIVMTFQRGSVTYVDADLRASLGQKLVGVVIDDKETRLVLDRTPPVVPSRPGEFLLNLNDSTPALFTAPIFDDRAFRDFCKRAEALRADEPHPPVLPDNGELERINVYPEIPEVETDPLTLAVWDLLRMEGPMQPSAIRREIQLRGDLDPNLIPGGDGPMGGVLKRMTGVRVVWDGNTKLYDLVPHPHGEPDSPRWLSARGELSPRSEHPEPPAASPVRGQIPPEPALTGPPPPRNGANGHVPPVPLVLRKVSR